VAAAADGDLEVIATGQVDRVHDVGDAEAAGDERRALVIMPLWIVRASS
jgi:hypothetical protein